MSDAAAPNLDADVRDLRLRIEALEATAALRAVIDDYFQYCDHLGETTPMDRLGALFTADAVWAGRGARYGAAFGERRGRDAIVAMLNAYRGPPPHFAFNAHFLGSETLQVSGSAAEGAWMMIQTSTYGDGRSDLRAAKINVRFALDDGTWRIQRFETENLFSRAIDHWHDAGPMPVPHEPPSGA